jgi:phospholipase/carboxylesterase
MATQLLRTRPERIVATVILAGFTLAAEQSADEQLASEKPRVIYCRGLQDDVISPDAVQRTLAWLKGHTSAEIYSYDGLGHSIDERVMEDVATYLQSVDF